jgi:(p)ppGpp synthase/HD superfamily hydrolase
MRRFGRYLVDRRYRGSYHDDHRDGQPTLAFASTVVDCYLTCYTDIMINRAKTIAIAAHSGQSYGPFPYSIHLAAVEEVISRFGFGHLVSLRAAAWLHDVLEDTDLNIETLRMEFGTRVAEAVFAVTDGEGDNRKERKAKVYAKIRQNGDDALIIKLADRIANVEAGGKVDMYRKEHGTFKNELYVTNTFNDAIIDMWAHLDSLLISHDTNL